MPPRRRAPAQTLSARIESTDEGSGGVEVLPKKAPVKRSTRRSATASVTVETAAAAVDKGEKKLTATAGGGGRKKKAAVNRVEEPTEDEDAPGDVGEEEGGEDDEEDVLEAAPVKSKSKVSTAAGKKATTAAAAAVKSKPKRGAKKVEVEIEGDDEEREATEEEKEVPAPVKKRGGRKAVPVEAAIPVVVAAAPVAEKKKRMTKKEKDAAAAAAKKAEAEEQGKEREIAETQYTPMQLDKDAVDGADDLMEVEATPTQAHSAPTVASKKAAAAGKKAGASKARGRAAKITEPEVVEEGEDDDDLALPAKPPIPVPPRRAGRRVAGNEVVLVAAGAGADTETEAYKSLEKAFHELETRHKKLEYVRETEAEQTFARYKQNAEIRAKEANKLIDSLQTDLNAQALLSSESKTLKKKLTSKEAEVAKLQSKVQELQRGLQEQQNEAKVLSAKLIVAENNSKRGAVAIPGSAVKPKGGIGGGGGGMVGAGQAAEEAWIAKVKEELFQDLTGLLVMNVKKEGKRTVFECLQTSSTGGLSLLPPGSYI
ncbi:hypothetical protein HOY82DRAFT_562956 [Tuber indicum]|nr:hypothetical protein HOY82DRAFT_562956 [Tuber indicum]